MTGEGHEQSSESLGRLLKTTRTSQGLEISDICSETKISGSNLRAMEEDDYGSLPADAFARGFYGLYAKALGLDADEIVHRFLVERGSPPKPRDITTQAPQSQKEAQKVSSMAEPSMFSPASTIGFVLLLLIILGGGLSWFFQINPASYISEKLQSLQGVELPTADTEELQQEPSPAATEQ